MTFTHSAISVLSIYFCWSAQGLRVNILQYFIPLAFKDATLDDSSTVITTVNSNGPTIWTHGLEKVIISYFPQFLISGR